MQSVSLETCTLLERGAVHIIYRLEKLVDGSPPPLPCCLLIGRLTDPSAEGAETS